MELIHGVNGKVCSKRITRVCYWVFVILHAEARRKKERKLVERVGVKVVEKEKRLSHRFEGEMRERKSYERRQDDPHRETTEERKRNVH
jgi:hypothetical protein